MDADPAVEHREKERMDYWEEKAVRLQGDGYILSKRRTAILPTAPPGSILFSPAVRVASNLITPESRSFAIFQQLIIEKYGKYRHWQTTYPSLLFLFYPPPDSVAIQVHSQWQISLLAHAATRSIIRDSISHHELGHHEFERHRYYQYLDTPDLKRTNQTIPEIYERYLTRVEPTYLKAFPFILNRYINRYTNRYINRYITNNLETSPPYSTDHQTLNAVPNVTNRPDLYFTSFFGDNFGNFDLGDLGDRQEIRQEIRKEISECNRFLYMKANGGDLGDRQEIRQEIRKEISEYNRFLYRKANGVENGEPFDAGVGSAKDRIIRQIRPIFFDSKLLTDVLRTYENRARPFGAKPFSQSNTMGILPTGNTQVKNYDHRYENQYTYLQDRRYQQMHRNGHPYESEPETKKQREIKKENLQGRSAYVTTNRLNMLKPATAGQILQNFRTVNPGVLSVRTGPAAEKTGRNPQGYLHTKQKVMLSHKQIHPPSGGSPIPGAPDSSREPGTTHREEPGHHASEILLEQIRNRTDSTGLLVNHSNRKIGAHWEKETFSSAAHSVEMALLKGLSPSEGDIENNNRHRHHGPLTDDGLERTVHHRASEVAGKNIPVGETVNDNARERVRKRISRNPLTYLDPRKADIGILKGSGMEKTGGNDGTMSEHTGQNKQINKQTFSGRDTGTVQSNGPSANGQGAYNLGPGSPKYQVPPDGRQPLQEIDKLIDMNRLADRLYRMLERKIRDERERRGR